jgi:hypothetical protein
MIGPSPKLVPNAVARASPHDLLITMYGPLALSLCLNNVLLSSVPTDNKGSRNSTLTEPISTPCVVTHRLLF